MEDVAVEQVDVVVIGAGFSGLYAIWRLRNEHKVVCLETGSGVGGTWYWNRYPGARVDIQSVEYSYGFDDDLQQEWTWPEQFSAQPDLERYANHVADRFGLRDFIRFSNPVTNLRFEAETDLWHVRTAKGDTFVCRYVIAATGALSVPNTPEWRGRELFSGQIFHTADWPRDGVDFTGKRVGFIGTGSTGIQAMPIIAEQAEHLTVFQRTPAFCMPSGNKPLDPAVEREWKENYPERRTMMLDTYGASLVDYGTRSALECSPEERNEILEKAWNSQSAFQLLVCFSDVMTDRAANEIVCEFVRGKIREIVKDPDTAETLCPTTYPIGGKRLCIGNGYFEMFNKDNVSLVDVRADPITAFTAKGLRTAAAEYELDAIITATGFDAVTGSMSRIDIKGVDGRTMSDKWANGPTTYLGAMVAGFPNLFMIHGPMTPAAQAQMITTGEWQVNWTADVIADMEREGYTRIDTTEAAEQSWSEELEMVSNTTVHKQADSWYNAKNIEGKKGGFMIYIGGFPRYSSLCVDAVEQGYKGFVRS
jgi:cyclohexanone monooxygenase